ncbi:MAG: hypothetical protein J0I41_08510 [Filimonas sp.]|nr:hypothetical protein [Filimonas sp.]
MKKALFIACLLYSFQNAVAQKKIICSINAVPAGWMITNVIKDCKECNKKTGWEITNLAVLPVGTVIKVCVFNNPPPGWIVTQNIHCTCCGATAPNSGNQWEMKRVK